MSKDLFITNAKTLDEFIAEMFSHPVSIRNTNGFKYCLKFEEKLKQNDSED